MAPHDVPITIRTATAADAPLVLRFIRELADYEREPDAVVATEDDLRRTLFGDASTARAVICECAGEAAGFAVFFPTFSTWLGRAGLHLEDLYVAPTHRGLGAGRALVAHLANLAVAEGYGRLEWAVLDWNTPSIDFYEALGAAPQTEWTTYRLTGEALTALAAEVVAPA
ncbi:GNAT family N-acetyltransferase [Nitriliruptor alkaliphilus]|uniref:GNAT family N-acetyltransferase n=1 Tax=Nitriliruptor alkaliphilus TaxID=427918 RepID=UPI00069679B0|nr:GNAT family N-acetyltransferase [Nitriliruptor alkaliphilus]